MRCQFGLLPARTDYRVWDKWDSYKWVAWDEWDMAHAAGEATDGGTTRHRAADLDTVVVSPDDVIAMMQRNDRDEARTHHHVLRVTAPLEGAREAALYVSRNSGHYVPRVTPKPLHFDARMLLGGSPGSPVPAECEYPVRTESRSRFREHYGLDSDHDLTDEQQEQWEEWWSVEVEEWESAVRARCTDREVTLGTDEPGDARTTVDVRFDDE